MKLLADENFPRPALYALRQAGFDILAIAELSPGVSDDEVLALCVGTDRTLLTFDKDFGELAYRRQLPAKCGIVLFRITPETPEELATLVLLAIRSQPTWAGYFSVVARQRIRMRPLPASPTAKPEET